MARLSEIEKREMLADAGSDSLRIEFDHLRRTEPPLTPLEFIEFLDWAVGFTTERSENRKAISGSSFLL